MSPLPRYIGAGPVQTARSRPSTRANTGRAAPAWARRRRACRCRHEHDGEHRRCMRRVGAPVRPRSNGARSRSGNDAPAFASEARPDHCAYASPDEVLVAWLGGRDTGVSARTCRRRDRQQRMEWRSL
jgi:hypothetical protein